MIKITTSVKFFILILFLISCKKDILINDQQFKKQDQQSLKSAFSISGYQSQLFVKIKDSIEITWQPNWSKIIKKSIHDSSIYYYVPLDLKMYNIKTKKQLESVVSNTDKYLLFKQVVGNELEMKLATYIMPY